jgi:perilipin-2
LPRIEAVNRIVSIPLVGNSLKSVESVYQRVKKSNGLTNWYFDTAEGFLKASVDTFAPVLNFVEGPIHKIDEVVCKSLEVVEQRVPIYLPPELVSNEYPESTCLMNYSTFSPS